MSKFYLATADEFKQLAYGKNSGGKNLLKPTLGTTTENGITCTNNSDGTYTLSGTASAQTVFTIRDIANVGDYCVSGCPSSGNADTYNIVVSYFDSDGKWKIERYEVGNGLLIDKTYATFNLSILVRNGQTLNNVVFKPMLVDATKYPNVKYDDFEPYVKSNKQLTHDTNDDLKMLGWDVPMECPVQNVTSGDQFTQLVDRVDLGSLDWTYQSNGKGYVFVSNQLNFLQSNIANNDVIYKAYCIDYIIVSANYLWAKNIDKTIAFAPAGNCLRICNKSYTDATAFKNAMQGVYLYYELANPITKNVDGNEAMNNYSPLIQSFSANESNFLTVGKKGARFTTITAAVLYAANYVNANNRVTIFVFPGVYNESINLMGFTGGVGTGLGNPGIDIIGCGWRNTIVKSTNTYPNAPIYTIGQGYFEGLAFVEDGVSTYALHYEAGGEKSNGVTRFNNCYFQTSASGGKSGVGAGLDANNSLELNNCIIRSEGDAPLYLHNRLGSNVLNQNIVVTNCLLYGKKTATINSKSMTYSVLLDDAARMNGLSNSKLNLIFANNTAEAGLAYRKTGSVSYSYLPNNEDITLDSRSIGNSIYGLTAGKNYVPVSYAITKPATAVYGQTYYHYSVPYAESGKYDWTVVSAVVSGLGSITSSVTIHKSDEGAIILKDTSNTGAGYNVDIVLLGVPK